MSIIIKYFILRNTHLSFFCFILYREIFFNGNHLPCATVKKLIKFWGECDISTNPELTEAEELMSIMAQEKIGYHHWYCVPDFCQLAMEENFKTREDQVNLIKQYNLTDPYLANDDFDCVDKIKSMKEKKSLSLV